MRALADQAVSTDLRRDYLTMCREWKEIARIAKLSQARPSSSTRSLPLVSA
jgi:hypothetical protein